VNARYTRVKGRYLQLTNQQDVQEAKPETACLHKRSPTAPMQPLNCLVPHLPKQQSIANENKKQVSVLGQWIEYIQYTTKKELMKDESFGSKSLGSNSRSEFSQLITSTNSQSSPIQP